MVARRPVDRLGLEGRLGFMFTRREALERGVCCKCGQRPDLSDRTAANEYRISAICDDCFTAIFADEEDEE